MKKLLVCCVCVNHKDLSNIFDNSSNKESNDEGLCADLRQKIFYCLGIKIDSDSKSNMLCKSCVLFINQFYQYKLQAIEVKKFLEDISDLIHPDAKAENITNYYKKLKQNINVADVPQNFRKRTYPQTFGQDVGMSSIWTPSSKCSKAVDIEIIDDEDNNTSSKTIGINENPTLPSSTITKLTNKESASEPNKHKNLDSQNTIEILDDDIPEQISTVQPSAAVGDSMTFSSKSYDTEGTAVTNNVRGSKNLIKSNVMAIIPENIILPIKEEAITLERAKSECFELLANEHGISSSDIYLIDKVIQESGALNNISSDIDMDEFIESTTTQILNSIKQLNCSNKSISKSECNLLTNTVTEEKLINARVIEGPPELVVMCKTPIYFCSYCEKNFKFRIQLSHHIKRNHLNKCLQCNRSYNTKYSLVRHQIKNGCVTDPNANTNSSTYVDWKLNVKPMLLIADFKNPVNGRADITKYTGKLQSDISAAIEYYEKQLCLYDEEVIELE